MKLLILTQYFPPETGAPQNRLYELALRLTGYGVEVQILTAMPNYPKMEVFEDYKGLKAHQEKMDGMLVHRTKIYVTKSKGIFKRLLNYFSFVLSSFRYGKKMEDFDFVLCESPPLFLGYSAMRLSKKLNAKLIFNVSDLWPESAEKLGLVSNKFFLKMAYKLEKKCYEKSTLITGQTQGIVRDISERFPGKRTYWLPNGVDTSSVDPEKIEASGFRQKYGLKESDFVLFYGGILGHAQGLDIIIKAANRLKEYQNIKFVLMGSGPLKGELEIEARSFGLKNVVFAEPVGRTEVASVIKEIDISVIPLRNLPLFLGAIPSKIFEVLSMKKPILLGVKGEAEDLFIREGKCGWSFEPENLEDMVLKINEIVANPNLCNEYGLNGRKYVDLKFNRDSIASGLYDKLVEVSEL